ncbi:MAG: hypothetical protein RIT14_1398, partial [Pseudomonadota bacterium]
PRTPVGYFGNGERGRFLINTLILAVDS